MQSSNISYDIKRIPVTIVMLVTALSLSLMSTFWSLKERSLILDWHMIRRGEFWRAFTNFFYFGPFGLPAILRIAIMTFGIYNLERQFAASKDGFWRFLFMVAFNALCCIALGAVFNEYALLSQSLSFAFLYIYCRKLPLGKVGGVVQNRWLPWALAGLDTVMTGNIYRDIIGLISGEAYLQLIE